MALPDRVQIFNAYRRSLRIAPKSRLNPKVVDIAGANLNVLGGATSLAGEEIVSAFASCMLGLWVETASGDALDRVAFDRYGLTRFPATPAKVDLTLTRPTFGAGGGTYPAGSRVQTSTGIQFATDTDIVFGATDLLQLGAGTALVAGPDGNVAAGAITAFADQPFDTTIVVTNGAAAGGTDVETDVAFRGRIRRFFPTVRRGTLGAIEFGGLEVAGIAVAHAEEVLNPSNEMPAAMVQLIVGDANGLATSGLLQEVRDSLLEFRAGGIPVDVITGTPTFVSVVWRVGFISGTNQAQAIDQLRAVTVASAQFLAPNEPLYRSDLIASANAVPGLVLEAGGLILPAGDIFPATTDQVLRIRPQDVAVNP